MQPNKMKTNQTSRRVKLNVVQFNIEVPERLHKRLKIIAAVDGSTIKDVALKAITDLYERRKGDIKLTSFDLPGVVPLGLELLAA